MVRDCAAILRNRCKSKFCCQSQATDTVGLSLIISLISPSETFESEIRQLEIGARRNMENLNEMVNQRDAENHKSNKTKQNKMHTYKKKEEKRHPPFSGPNQNKGSNNQHPCQHPQTSLISLTICRGLLHRSLSVTSRSWSVT